MILAGIALTLGLQASFVETGKLGVTMKVGAREVENGKEQDWGNYVLLALNSARVELYYPCVKHIVEAESGKKLVVFNLTITNLSRLAIILGASSMPLFTLWNKKALSGMELVGYYDPKTKLSPDGVLEKGRTASFDMVVSVPANFNDFRVGFGWYRIERVAWLDMRNKVGKVTSIFAPNGIRVRDTAKVEAKSAFDLGPFNMKINGVLEEEDRRGQVAASVAGTVLSVTVANPQAAPVWWGSRHLDASLVFSDGSKSGMHSSVYDQGTGERWIGYLDPGLKTTSQLLFGHELSKKPVALELTWKTTKRRVVVRL